MATDKTPIFNVKAVVRETGLKPDTLRAWERRYGILEPKRTDGGHRLYSRQDIQTIKWLLMRQAEGMSVSRAINLWREIQTNGRDPLQVYPLTQNHELAIAETVAAVDQTIFRLRRLWIDACMAFDEKRAEQVIYQAFSFYSPEIVCTEVLQKALAEIGDGWYEGMVSVQQEHFASALAMRRLEALMAASPAPTRSGRILTGCPPGETHTFSALLLSYLLRRQGWDVVYIGGDVPLDRLEETIRLTRPDLVVFSAQSLDTAASLLDIARFLYDSDVPFAFGGHIFSAVPDLNRRIPGHFLGRELSAATQIAEDLVTDSPPTPEGELTSDEYKEAWTYFHERSGVLESYLRQTYSREEQNGSGSVDIYRYLSNNILSALKLGDLSIIDYNLQWLEGLLTKRRLSPRALCDFLQAVHQAAVVALDGPAGQPIRHWLEGAVVACESSTYQSVDSNSRWAANGTG
jgi:DNA-binding transcriptional MerR regulator